MMCFLNLLIGLSVVLLHDEATLCVFSATGEGMISFQYLNMQPIFRHSSVLSEV